MWTKSGKFCVSGSKHIFPTCGLSLKRTRPRARGFLTVENELGSVRRSQLSRQSRTQRATVRIRQLAKRLNHSLSSFWCELVSALLSIALPQIALQFARCFVYHVTSTRRSAPCVGCLAALFTSAAWFLLHWPVFQVSFHT